MTVAASFCHLEKANDKREGKRGNRMEVKKKTKKGIFHIVFSRTALVFLLLIFQVVLLFEMFTSLVKYAREKRKSDGSKEENEERDFSYRI